MENIPDFDWEFYLQYNNDVQIIYGYNIHGAVLHYNEHGKYEDRIYSENMLFKRYPSLVHFDWEYYRDNNSDLLNLNRYKLYDHYINQGYKEKRNVFFSMPIFHYLCQNITVNSYVPKSKISVIMPVFNRHEHIENAINSIIHQSYENWELVVIDDGSNDITKNVLKKYSSHEKITILTNEQNYGCYTSINLGLALCNGDYITVHGSDDVSTFNRFKILLSVAEQEKLLMVGNYILRTHFTTFDHIDVNENLFGQIVTQKLDNICHDSECCKPMVALGILMYHKSVFRTLGCYENIRKGGDMILFEKFLFEYENISFTKYDCSHRYLTKFNKGNNYKIIDEILYLSANMNSNNITKQKIPFDINNYRRSFTNSTDVKT